MPFSRSSADKRSISKVEVPSLGLGEEDAVRQFENLGCRAVVRLYPVDMGPRVSVRKGKDVLGSSRRVTSRCTGRRRRRPSRGDGTR